jgi:hypothetical protein
LYEGLRMLRWLKALAMGGLLMAAALGRGAWGQDEQMAFDPVLGGQSPMDVMLLHAGYEQNHMLCQDADKRTHAVLVVKPDWVGAQAVLLVCEANQGRMVDEIQDLTRIVALAPENPTWWQMRASAYAKYLYFDNAIADTSKAIALLPRNEFLYRQRSEWRAERQDFAGEFEDLESLHELRPEDGSLWLEMANLAQTAGKTDAEELRDRQMAQINPPVLPAEERDDSKLSMAGMSRDELMLRAGYAVRTKKTALALRFLNTVLNVEPRYIPALEMRYQLKKTGVSTATRNRRAEPAWHVPDDLKLLVELYPIRWLDELVNVTQGHVDDKVRLEYVTQMIALGPYYASLYIQRALLERDLKLVDAAMEDYRRAFYLEPNNPEGYIDLAQIFEDRKNYEREAQMVTLALIGAPNNARLKMMVATLRKDCPGCGL